MAQYVYLQKGRGEAEYRRRGEVGPNDNPQGFARMMARHGLKVMVAEEDLGAECTESVLERFGARLVEG